MARKSRGIPEINAGSMADIAFLLLIFFLVTTTMDTDQGISILLPPIPKEKVESETKKKNVLEVLINSQDQLLVEEKWMNIKDLRGFTKTFITNWGKDPNLSDSPDDAIVSLKNDRGTSYDTYLQVQNELKAAYNEVRDEEAMKKFDRVYSKLPEDKKAVIKKMYPIRISEAEPVNIGGN